VVEAYRFGDKDSLVDVTMNQLTLELEDSPGVPIEPTWDVGTDSDSSDKIHYATGRLQLYKIEPSKNNTTLTFTRKVRQKAEPAGAMAAIETREPKGASE
jgi:hypothetical protein